MRSRLLRKPGIAFLVGMMILIFVQTAYSQIPRFIYVQSDNQKPFWLRVQHRLVSSTSGGYAIIPDLHDSTYTCEIGFVGEENAWQFSVTLRQKDLGFVLKNFGDKGWGLYNWQSMDILYGKSVPSGRNNKPDSLPVRPNSGGGDPFAMMLAAAVDDPVILEKPVIMQSETVMAKNPTSASQAVVASVNVPIVEKDLAKAESIKNIPEKDSTLPVIPVYTSVESPQPQVNPVDPALQDTINARQAPPAEVVQEKSGGDSYLPFNRSKVTRVLMVKNQEGYEMMFLDDNGAKGSDTIRLWFTREEIPSQIVKGEVSNEVVRDVASNKSVSEGIVVTEATLPPTSREERPILEVNAGDSLKEKPKQEGKDARFLGFTLQPPVKDSVKFDGNNETYATGSNNDASQVTDSARIPEKKGAVDSAGRYSVGASGADSVQAVEYVHTGCRGRVDPLQVDSLKVRLEAAEDDEERVLLAARAFKKQCYSSEEIKVLTLVMTDDAGRYKLLDAGYAYVHDPANYAKLESLLLDTYNRNRFRALLK